jgi:hypothetical protein
VIIHWLLEEVYKEPVKIIYEWGLFPIGPTDVWCRKERGHINLYCLRVGKVKCTPVQALRLCTGRTAHRRSRGIALLFHDHGTRRGWGVSVTPRPLFTPGKTRRPMCRRLDGLHDRSGQVQKILLLTGIRSPYLPARRQLLNRLSYPALTCWAVPYFRQKITVFTNWRTQHNVKCQALF